jgi:hypothetical protein
MSGSLLEHPRAPEFIRELQEEHLSELGFLLRQRGRFMRSGEVPWPRVEEWETRMTSQLEAMLPWWRDALLLVPPPAAARACLPALRDARLEVRATAAEVLGRCRQGRVEELLSLLEDPIPRVRVMAALALARLGHHPALTVIESLAAQSPLNEVEPLLRACFLLGSRRARDMCRAACECPDVPGELVLLLGIAGQERDASLVRHLWASAQVSEAALMATGLLGQAAAVPHLIDFLGTAPISLRPPAARALELMTGAGLVERARVVAEPEDPDEEPTVREVVRPSTCASSWSRWWAGHQRRFAGGGRFRQGRRFDGGACIAQMEDPDNSLPVRELAALEWGIHTGHPPGFEVDGPVASQRRELRELRRWWETR